MKKFSILLLISGLFVTFIGLFPFIFTFPLSDGPNSGPSNLWQLILIISFEGKEWYLFFGIVLLSLSFINQRKVQL